MSAKHISDLDLAVTIKDQALLIKDRYLLTIVIKELTALSAPAPRSVPTPRSTPALTRTSTKKAKRAKRPPRSLTEKSMKIVSFLKENGQKKTGELEKAFNYAANGAMSNLMKGLCRNGHVRKVKLGVYEAT